MLANIEELERLQPLLREARNEDKAQIEAAAQEQAQAAAEDATAGRMAELEAVTAPDHIALPMHYWSMRVHGSRGKRICALLTCRASCCWMVCAAWSGMVLAKLHLSYTVVLPGVVQGNSPRRSCPLMLACSAAAGQAGRRAAGRERPR